MSKIFMWRNEVLNLRKRENLPAAGLPVVTFLMTSLVAGRKSTSQSFFFSTLDLVSQPWTGFVIMKVKTLCLVKAILGLNQTWFNRRCHWIGMLVFAVGASSSLAARETNGLKAAFRNPPNEYRLVQYGLDEQSLQTFPRYGIGGYMAFFYALLYQAGSSGPGRIGPLVDAANAQGRQIWLADDFGYPSGLAGGLAVKAHPEYEVRGLAMVTRDGT